MRRMRVRAGRCLSTIRLHLMTTAAHTLTAVAAHGTHVLSPEGARDRDPRIHALLRTLARVEEELRPYLPRSCLLYLFADIARSCYRFVMWSVAKVEAVNNIGLERFLQCDSQYLLPRPAFCKTHRRSP
jgi:hypothetical protein